MNGLYPIIRRQRRSLQSATMPDTPPAAVCPHCGRSVTDGHHAGPVVPEVVQVSKPKKSRDHAPEN